MGSLLDAILHEGIPISIEVGAAHIQHCLSTLDRPAHTGTLHAVLDEMATGALDNPGGDGIAQGEILLPPSRIVLDETDKAAVSSLNLTATGQQPHHLVNVAALEHQKFEGIFIERRKHPFRKLLPEHRENAESRFTHSVYYANSQQLSDEIRYLIHTANPPLRWLCLDASAVDDVDYSAAETLRSIYRILKEKDVRLTVAQVLDDVKAESRYQLRQLFGENAFYDTLEDVINDFTIQTTCPPVDTPSPPPYRRDNSDG